MCSACALFNNNICKVYKQLHTLSSIISAHFDKRKKLKYYTELQMLYIKSNVRILNT